MLGVQGAQTQTSSGRGLSRYVQEQTVALVTLHPDAVAQVSYDPTLPLPPDLAALEASTELAPAAARPSGGGPLVYHVMSPFEFLNLDRLWPVWAQAGDVGLVVTLHDLIPLTYPERYLGDPHSRRFYLPRLELVREADAVVAVSESAAREARDLLGIQADRLFVSHEDCGPLFTADPDRSSAFQRAQAGVPALRPEFIVYVGGMDYRKNISVLLEAYARLEPGLRARHQLVIAGRHHPHETELLQAELARRGIQAETIVTGYIADAVLADLYRSCACLVLPSLHEGFGLTVLEAMRCGAAALVSDATSLPELVPWREARFDPTDAGALLNAVRRVLTDDAFRESLQAKGLAESGKFSWARSAAALARAYERAARSPAGA